MSDLQQKILQEAEKERPEQSMPKGKLAIIVEQKETIETLLKKGYSLAQVCKYFNNAGVKVSLTTFRKHWNAVSGKKKKG